MQLVTRGFQTEDVSNSNSFVHIYLTKHPSQHPCVITITPIVNGETEAQSNLSNVTYLKQWSTGFKSRLSSSRVDSLNNIVQLSFSEEPNCRNIRKYQEANNILVITHHATQRRVQIFQYISWVLCNDIFTEILTCVIIHLLSLKILLFSNVYVEYYILGLSIFDWGLPGGLDDKRICLQCRRPRFNPWDGRIPHGKGNGYPLQYSCLENPMDRGD